MHYKVYYAGNSTHIAEWWDNKSTQGTADAVHVDPPADNPGKNAALAITGGISGTVTEETSGIPLENIQVQLYNSATYTYTGVYATTGADGTYTCVPIPAGYYKVYYAGDSTHLSEWYNNKASHSVADQIQVINGNITTGKDAALTQAFGTISGTVTGSEAPTTGLAGIEVKVFTSDGIEKATLTTGVSGAYTTGNILPSGTYKVRFGGNSDHLGEWYNDQADLASATSVSVAFNGTTTANAVLAQGFGSISGTIIGSESGDPALSGIEVRIYDSSDALEATVYTNGSGYYSSGDLSSGDYRIWFGGDSSHLAHQWYNSQPDLASATPVTVNIPSATTVDLALTQAFGTISGTVTGSESGNPALNLVEVRVYDSGNNLKTTVYTDEYGFYTSDGILPTGNYKVYFGGDSSHALEWYNNKSSQGSADLVPVAIPSTVTIDATLTQGSGTITGTVKGGASGDTVLPDIEVEIYDSGNNLTTTVTTESSGVYTATGLAVDNYKVYFAGNPTHLAEWNLDKSSIGTADPVSITGIGTVIVNATLTQAFGTISGTVVGSENIVLGIDGIAVTVYNGATPIGSATTAAGGLYSIGSLPSGSYKVSFGGNSTHLPTDNLAVAVVLNQTTTSNATLTQAFGTISGTIFGSESGNPMISGIQVKVYSSSDVEVGSATTNGSGAYSVGNLPTGSYKIWYGGNTTHLAEYYNDQASLGSANLVSVTIPSTVTINATLTQAFGTISGNVKGSESGTPNLAGIVVNVYSSADVFKGTATTDASGTYSVGTLPTGSYKVSFGSNANHLAEYYNDKGSLGAADLVSVTIPSTTPNINAVLTEAYGAISGNVKGSESGTPNLAGITVNVYSSADVFKGTATTDASGNYSIGNLPTGSYKVSFGADSTHLAEWNLDRSSQGSADLVSVTIPSTTTVNATLTQAFGTISGNVKGAESGTPNLAGIVVNVYSSADVFKGTATTDASGNYSVGTLPTGSYKVSFGADATHLAEWNLDKSSQGSADLVSVTIPSTTMVNATLSRDYGKISGNVKGSESGTPNLAGITVNVYSSTDVLKGTATTDASGNYLVEKLPTGSYKVSFGADSTHLAEWNLDKSSQGTADLVSVTIPSTTTVNATLTQAFGTISGNVKGSESGTPNLSGITVNVYSSADVFKGTATTDASGNYSVGNLPTGSYKVSFGSDSTHLAEWNLDKSSQGAADLVSVTIPSATTVNATLTQAFGTITGNVKGSESGTPNLAGIVVNVYSSADVFKGTATTDASGNYSVGNLPTGSYKVSFGADSTHLAEWNLDKSSQGAADLVSVTIPSATTVNATLTQAFGAISGTVRGSESGTPVLANVEVKVYNGSDVQVGSTATTDCRRLLLRRLTMPSGTYRVHFGGDSTHLAGDNTGVVVTIPATTTSNSTLTQAFGTISGMVTGSETAANLLTGSQASFEDGATNYTPTKCDLAVVSTSAFHGSKSLQATCNSTAGQYRSQLDIVSITSAGSQYTLSVWVKAGNPGAVGKTIKVSLIGSSSGSTHSSGTTLTAGWQRATVTKTFSAGDTYRIAYLFISTAAGDIGDTVLADAAQLEAGATATPFGLAGVPVTVYNASDQQVGTATTAGGGYLHRS